MWNHAGWHVKSNPCANDVAILFFEQFMNQCSIGKRFWHFWEWQFRVVKMRQVNRNRCRQRMARHKLFYTYENFIKIQIICLLRKILWQWHMILSFDVKWWCKIMMKTWKIQFNLKFKILYFATDDEIILTHSFPSKNVLADFGFWKNVFLHLNLCPRNDRYLKSFVFEIDTRMTYSLTTNYSSHREPVWFDAQITSHIIKNFFNSSEFDVTTLTIATTTTWTRCQTVEATTAQQSHDHETAVEMGADWIAVIIVFRNVIGIWLEVLDNWHYILVKYWTLQCYILRAENFLLFDDVGR